MLKNIAIGVVALTSLTAAVAAPAALYDDCYDACMLNCLRIGDEIVCSGNCADHTCRSVRPVVPEALIY